MRSGSSAMMAALLLLSGGAWAQEAKKGPSESKGAVETAKTSQESPTFEDLKGSLGDLEQKENKEEKEKREAIVQKNYDDTLKIYGEALGKRDGELMNVSRRLDVNKGLQTKYDRLLAASRTALATMRAQYINRTLALKKSLDEGKISKEVYEKLLEEDSKRFRNREKELSDDIAFYQGEVQNAERASKDLAVKKELMQFDPFGGERQEEQQKAPKPGIAQKLQSTLAEVSGYRARSVTDLMK